MKLCIEQVKCKVIPLCPTGRSALVVVVDAFILSWTRLNNAYDLSVLLPFVITITRDHPIVMFIGPSDDYYNVTVGVLDMTLAGQAFFISAIQSRLHLDYLKYRVDGTVSPRAGSK